MSRQWPLAAVHDMLYCSKQLRTLNPIDEGVREYLTIEVDASFQVERVIWVLDQLKEECGLL